MAQVVYPYYQSIPIQDLAFDLLNPRFPPNSDQVSARETMLKKHGKEIFGLAQHIIRLGKLNPSDLTIVVPDPQDDTGKKFIVIEGNRRLTALRLLEDPSLAQAEGLTIRQQNEFQELAIKFAKKPVREVLAVVYPDREDPEVKEWRQLKHSATNATSDGAATLRWSGFMKERDRAGSNPSYQFRYLDKVLAHTDTPEEVLEALNDERLPISTIGRALDNSAIRETLGIERQKDQLSILVDTNEFQRRALAFLSDFVRPAGSPRAKKTETDISKAEQQRDYASELKERLGLTTPKTNAGSTAAPDAGTAGPTTSGNTQNKKDDNNPSTSPAKRKTSKPRATSSNRAEKHVVPSSFKPAGLDHKAERLLKELRERLLIEATPIVIAVGIRTMVEYSLAAFFKTHLTEQIPQGLKGLGARVASFMSDANNACDNSNKALKKSQGKNTQLQPLPYDHQVLAALHKYSNFQHDSHKYSLQTMHEFVHNPSLPPEAEELRNLWGAYEDIIRMLWHHIHERRKATI